TQSAVSKSSSGTAKSCAASESRIPTKSSAAAEGSAATQSGDAIESRACEESRPASQSNALSKKITARPALAQALRMAQNVSYSLCLVYDREEENGTVAEGRELCARENAVGNRPAYCGQSPDALWRQSRHVHHRRQRRQRQIQAVAAHGHRLGDHGRGCVP